MKLVNQKGITIVMLVITIIVLIIITSITVYTGGNIIKKANLQTINADMLLIQVKAKTIQEQANFNNDTSNYKGTVLTNITGNKDIDKVKNAGAIDNAQDCYYLSKEDLESMGLGKINYDLGYIVNYNTEEIIYVKGFENDGTTYYKLSELKNLSI